MEKDTMIQTIHSERLNRKKNTDHGFTIIEVLMAISIFAIGILGVAAMQMASVSGNTSARGVTDIATWAADRVEKLMILPYDDISLAPGVYSIGAGTLTMTTDGIDNDYEINKVERIDIYGLIDEGGETGPVTIAWTIVENTPVDNTKTLTITVQHNGPGVNKNVTMARVVPNIV